ncbi:DUF2231 domain-containing protein [Kribbella turkmenica]|uniref:DUF2231 domain-containing protein n=1 Tax=Kribbella turkmenica TaxID=2530375 RepID=A0A4R4WI12_9ACTN|nr:DUF2231 domain-containing protein [Kribbella turkmenica]TDD18001.1 DUF2231 domain-containing protein [Kribbella turkmenica]
MNDLERAKRPKNSLAGPYGHPFHPVLVTVPIGAWVASAVFDIVALAGPSREAVFAEGAYWLIGIGLVGAVVAAVFGLMDLLVIPRGTKVFRTGLLHMSLNLVVVILFAVDFAVRANQERDQASVGGFVLSLVALALLSASGWLGGQLAYHYGVRVANEETQREGFR